MITSRVRFSSAFVLKLLDEQIALIKYEGVYLISTPYVITRRQMGELWVRVSQGSLAFGQVLRGRSGAAKSRQLDALLNEH
jgi:hypothetical protein